jgi:hypothetical protein
LKKIATIAVFNPGDLTQLVVPQKLVTKASQLDKAADTDDRWQNNN